MADKLNGAAALDPEILALRLEVARIFSRLANHLCPYRTNSGADCSREPGHGGLHQSYGPGGKVMTAWATPGYGVPVQ